MTLKRHPELLAFLSTQLSDDPGADVDSAKAYGAAAPAKAQAIIAEGAGLLGAGDLPLDDLGAEANRWFGDGDEARAWLESVLAALQESAGGSGGGAVLVVKDSNGTALAEGDAVTVIKDLKVKGGSSDLKRGTLIKKIHLVDDPEVVECRVDGSTLVLKTCFLKKA
jgi:protein PhnA